MLTLVGPEMGMESLDYIDEMFDWDAFDPSSIARNEDPSLGN